MSEEIITFAVQNKAEDETVALHTQENNKKQTHTEQL